MFFNWIKSLPKNSPVSYAEFSANYDTMPLSLLVSIKLIAVPATLTGNGAFVLSQLAQHRLCLPASSRQPAGRERRLNVGGNNKTPALHLTTCYRAKSRPSDVVLLACCARLQWHNTSQQIRHPQAAEAKLVIVDEILDTNEFGQHRSSNFR